MKRRGFTLLEVLVGSFLAALLLTILVRVASVTYRVGHAEIARASLEEQAAVITSKLEQDILATAPAGLTLSGAGDRLVTNPIIGLSSGGRKEFDSRLIFWSFGSVAGKSGSSLIRSEITSHKAITDAMVHQPIRLTPADLLALPVGAGQRQSNIFSGVSLFTVTPSAGISAPQVSPTLIISLELDLPLDRARPKVKAERLVTLRTTGL